MNLHNFLCHLIVCMFASAPLCASSDTVIESWQMTRLFKPTQADLVREARGSVMIYDGLTDKTIDKALDSHFERIDAMMFTRVVVTDDAGEPLRDEVTGEIIVEDDGCE